MPIDKEFILDYFSRRQGHGHGRMLHEAFYYLMRIIFLQKDFEDLDHLTAFCGQPANLSAWIANENDQVVFAAGLRDALRDMVAEAENDERVTKMRKSTADKRQQGITTVFQKGQVTVIRQFNPSLQKKVALPGK